MLVIASYTTTYAFRCARAQSSQDLLKSELVGQTGVLWQENESRRLHTQIRLDPDIHRNSSKRPLRAETAKSEGRK